MLTCAADTTVRELSDSDWHSSEEAASLLFNRIEMLLHICSLRLIEAETDVTVLIYLLILLTLPNYFLLICLLILANYFLW